jgi:1,4-dihydroxy-2-naphthoate octaprenyltransferase
MATLWTWFRATQPHSFVASLVGVFLGTAIAWERAGAFDLVPFLLACAGVVALHAGTNMSNDTVDFLHGVDNLPPEKVTPFTGGAHVLPRGELSIEAHRRAWVALFAIGGIVGLYLFATRPNGWILLVLGLIGGTIGMFYTLPPLSLQYHGFGDVAVAIVFGPIVVLGSYAVQAGSLSWEPFLASIPLALLVTAFLLVNEMPEVETDSRGGKWTIPARIGLERSVMIYEALVFGALLLLVSFVLARQLPWVALVGLVSLLPLWKARGVLRVHYREFPAHIPANAGTIQAVLLLGASLTVAYVVRSFVPSL